jgi:hypothetical protein
LESFFLKKIEILFRENGNYYYYYYFPKVIELGTTIFSKFCNSAKFKTQTKEVVPHFYMFWD